tara:strand:- start:3639 stop:3968 length:330 start_codon:yes stop_codon:yes gene_type:complete
MKYNFSMLGETDPFLGLIIEINNATYGLWASLFLLFIFVVSTYVFLNRTNDIGKSTIMSIHLVVLIGLILFYAGRMVGHTLINETIMLGLILLEVGSLAGAYFMRSKGL